MQRSGIIYGVRVADETTQAEGFVAAPVSPFTTTRSRSEFLALAGLTT
ncbi:hypothetical protein ACH4SK_39230 [Streptomyces inhibens]